MTQSKRGANAALNFIPVFAHRHIQYHQPKPPLAAHSHSSVSTDRDGMEPSGAEKRTVPPTEIHASSVEAKPRTRQGAAALKPTRIAAPEVEVVEKVHFLTGVIV